MINKPIRKRLLIYIRMAIDFEDKRLLILNANHYSFAHETATDLRANDYYNRSCLQLLHATSLRRYCSHIDAVAALRSDTSPPAAEAVGGDVYLSSRDFLLQAIGNYLGEPELPCW